MNKRVQEIIDRQVQISSEMRRIATELTKQNFRESIDKIVHLSMEASKLSNELSSYSLNGNELDEVESYWNR